MFEAKKTIREPTVMYAKFPYFSKIARQLHIDSGYFFIAPAFALIFPLVVYPALRVIWLSLIETNRQTGESTFVGLSNYVEILNDPIFLQALKQTIIFSIFSSIGHILLGIILALIMNMKLNYQILRFCRSTILIPWAISPIVVAIIVRLWAYPPISPITKTLAALGFEVQFAPLANPHTALWSLIAVNIWQFTPFYMLMILSGLQSLDPELIDAAKIDGATTSRLVFHVYIPHIRDLLLTLMMFDLATTASYFDLIWVTTQGGPVRSTEVLVTYIYRRAFANMNWNIASAAGVILLLLSIGIAVVSVVKMQRD